MLNILLFTIGLCFVIQMILVGGYLFGIGACVVIVALIILGFLKKRAKWMTAIGIVLIAVCMIGVTSEKRENYISNYGDELKNIEALIDECETKQALERLFALEEKYGMTEDIILQKTYCYYTDSNFENAITVMKEYPHKKSKSYFNTMEMIYKGMEQDGKEELHDLYVEAATEWPSWLEMQLSAGLAKLERAEYKAAEYYFQKSYYLDYENGMASYFLGVTAYYQGNYKECLRYYNQALEKGVSDEVKDSIASQIIIVQGASK